MEKKYQVFISSTYTDLIEARQEAIKAVLSSNQIPAGMEWFTASPAEQLQFIKKIIDQCDYYILIIAARYGSVTKEGISFTEKEFNYAVDTGKHILVFPHRHPEKIAGEHTELEAALRKRLDGFRTSAMTGRVVEMWETPHELRACVTAALNAAIRDYPGKGWVRGDQVSSRESDTRIIALERQISELTSERDDARLKLKMAHDEAKIASTVDPKPLKPIGLVPPEATVGVGHTPDEHKRLAILEAMSVINTIATERVQGNPLVADSVKALNEAVSKVVSVNSPPAVDGVELSKRLYDYEWQARLFKPLDDSILRLQNEVGYSAKAQFEGLLEQIDRLARYSFLNSGLNTDDKHYEIEDYLQRLRNISSPRIAKTSDEIIKLYRDVSNLRNSLMFDAPITSASLGSGISKCFQVIDTLKSGWTSTWQVLSADRPFCTEGGDEIRSSRKALVILEYLRDQEPKTLFLGSRVQGLKKDMFVTATIDDQKSLGEVYYRPREGGAVQRLFKDGKIFIGQAILF